MQVKPKSKWSALSLLLLIACTSPCRGGEAEEPWLAFPDADLRFQIVTDAPSSPMIGDALFGMGYRGA